MQTPATNPFSGAALFSRERRRQRMLQFLERFERRSWRGEAELPFLLPFAKSALRDAELPSSEQKAS